MNFHFLGKNGKQLKRNNLSNLRQVEFKDKNFFCFQLKENDKMLKARKELFLELCILCVLAGDIGV